MSQIIVIPQSNGQVTLTAGQNINAFMVITVNPDGRAYIASAATAADAGKIVGVATTSATTGNTIQVQMIGEVDNLGFNFTPGSQLFLGLNGALTTSPALGSFEQPIGVAASASRLLLTIGLPIVLA